MPKQKKVPTMKRKFSIDIPRMRLGSSKTETSASKDAVVIDVDSPPQTPKSVRPPLSPKVDHELRLACAYVLQDFKPSNQVYEERYGKYDDDEPQLDYSAVKQAVPEATEASASALYQKATRMQPQRPKAEQAVTTSQSVNKGKRSDDLDSKPLPSQDILTGRKSQDSEEQRSATIPIAMPPIPPDPVEAKSVSSHKRSASFQREHLDHPRTAPRSNSVGTDVSTPQTEGTEYGFPSSTAPTTAAITPARSSMRQSNQALVSRPDSTSQPKFLASDTEWMIKELERHRKAQDEARAQQELEEQVIASLGTELTPTRTKPPPTPNTQCPRRKPVPKPSTDFRQSPTGHRMESKESIDVIYVDENQPPPIPPMEGRESVEHTRGESRAIPVPHLDSRQSADIVRSESRKRRSAPRAESKHELDMLRPESRQSRRERWATEGSAAPSRSGSVSRTWKDYFLPASARPSADISRPPSRSRSFARRMQDNAFRSTNRNESVDISQPPSRSQSINSTRSAVSAIAPSVESSTSKWRSWKPFHRNQENGNSAIGSRPGTADSNITPNQTMQQSPPKKKKPPINLNRELPPLPSLDQWKPVEPEQPKSATSTKQTHPLPDDQPAAHGINPALDGTPAEASHVTSRPHPTSSRTSPTLQTEANVGRRRSKAGDSTRKDEKLDDAPGQPRIARQASVGKAHVVNFSKRTSSMPSNINTTPRTGKRPNPSPALITSPPPHVRSTSEQEKVSRRPNESGYTRVYEQRYQNKVEIPSPSSTAASPVAEQPRDKSKKKWWQPGKTKKEMTWMDRVVKSGSRSGLVVMDDAGEPVARY